MRTIVTLIVILAVIAGAIALFLYVTTPHETAAVTFPLSGEARAMIASAPASADAFAYIPRAAALQSKLNANPITRGVIASWSSTRALPRPWMIGGADLLMWQTGKETRYLLRLDPVRAALVRAYLMATGGSGPAILINASSEPPIAPDELARIESLAATLPAADAIVVQRSGARGAFPPIPRPAVSSVAVTPADIVVTSHAFAAAGRGGPLNARLAKGALISASFASMPRLFEDLNRLFGRRVSDLVGDGGSIAIYDIDTGKLLPRPLGVIALPATGDRRPATELLDKLGARTAERDGELLVAFDDSIDTYQKDTIDASTVPNGRWAVRLDPPRLAPILGQLEHNIGLRIASPRLFRGARDLERWIGSLERAKTIDAVDLSDGTTEELKVRITAK